MSVPSFYNDWKDNLFVQVRRIRPEEWREFRRIRLAALQDAPDAFGSSYDVEVSRPDDEWQQRAERLAMSAGAALFVGIDEAGEWRGLAGGFRPGEPGTDADVFSMWVHPAARRSGLGRLLLDAVVDWAAEAGARTVGLWVTRGNDPAATLYERAGFTLTGDIQPLPSNPCKDENRMVRTIERD